MIETIKYSKDKKEKWDVFVASSDIPIFMFYRDYIDYHKERFNDHSLIIFKKGKIIALIPGHLKDNCYYSHMGLTFGGLIVKKHTGFKLIKEIYNSICRYLEEKNISGFQLKLQPSFYSETYSQSQTFLFQSNIKSHTDIKLGTCIYTHKHAFPKSSIEKRKLNLNQFELNYSDDLESFWNILENNLSTFHNTKPVHSLDEIIYLRKLFPEGIKLFVAKNKQTGKIDAGAVLYVFKNIIKLQYLAVSNEGRANRASHALYYGFISKYKAKVDFIDLGNCMDDIDVINYNLLYIKERFGATVYPMYSFVTTTNLTV